MVGLNMEESVMAPAGWCAQRGKSEMNPVQLASSSACRLAWPIGSRWFSHPLLDT